MKRCIECQNSKTEKWYSGPICRKCYSKQYYKNIDLNIYAAKSSAYRRTERGSFNVTKSNAKKKGIEWSLSFEEFKKIRINKKCEYCNGPLPLVCGGLDRKNNKIGYLFENVVPCCSNCNYVKRDLISYEEMKEIIKILKNMRKGKVWIDL